MAAISFVLPAFKAEYLAQSIESILSQSFSDWELIIVDDCSPDPIKDIVSKFNDDRIRYYRNSENIGSASLVRQWNHSISFACGEWLVLASDDDVYSPGFCTECLSLIDSYPAVDLIRSRVEQIGEYGEHLWDDGIIPEYMSKEEYFKMWMDAKVFDCIGNFVFRRRSLIEIGGFVEMPCAFGSDIVTPVLLSRNGVASTKEMLFHFRQSSVHLSGDYSKLPQKLEAISQMYEWFDRIDYIEPYQTNLHRKCVYDYFNLVIRHLPFSSLFPMLAKCRRASLFERSIMVIRWIKRNLLT